MSILSTSELGSVAKSLDIPVSCLVSFPNRYALHYFGVSVHRYMAETLLSTYKYVDEVCSDGMVYLRVKARELCCYPTPGKSRTSHYISGSRLCMLEGRCSPIQVV